MWFNEYKRIVTKNGEEPLSPIGGLLGGMSAGCFSVRFISYLVYPISSPCRDVGVPSYLIHLYLPDGLQQSL